MVRSGVGWGIGNSEVYLHAVYMLYINYNNSRSQE